MQVVQHLVIQQGNCMNLVNIVVVQITSDISVLSTSRNISHMQKDHGLLFICPLLRGRKGQEKDYRGCKSNDPSLDYSEMDHEVRGNVRNAQVHQVIAPPTPVIDPSEHLTPQDLHFDTGFPWGRSTPGIQ